MRRRRVVEMVREGAARWRNTDGEAIGMENGIIEIRGELVYQEKIY